MNKQEIYSLLKEKALWHEITEHKAVFNMAELYQIETPYPAADAKNLFVRDDKRRNYYLIVVKGDKKVDLKEFRRRNSTRPLSFASEQELLEQMGLTPGSVTPFGILNDAGRQITVFLDSGFLSPPGLIGVHPNENTATVWMKTADLIDIMKEHGNPVILTEIA